MSGGKHDLPKQRRPRKLSRKAGGATASFTGRRTRIVGGAALLVVVLLVAAVVRLVTMDGPQLNVKQVLSSTVVFPGQAPKVAWPTQGEASVGVPGIDSMSSAPAQKPIPTASLAKVMTAYVVLHDSPLGPGNDGFSYVFNPLDVAAANTGAGQLQSSLKVAPGEALNERQLIEALMVPSADNIAAILATHDAGSVPAFVNKMNSTAASLGMSATTYTDPSGLQTTTVSTAADQLRLAEAAMQIPDLAQIAGMKNATFPVAGTVANFNPLIGQDGVFGIKTGSESQSGGNLMFAANKPAAGKNITIFGVVMGQDVGQENTNTLLGAAASASTAILDSTAAGITTQTVLPSGSSVLAVTNADGHAVAVKTTKPLTALGWGGAHISLQVKRSSVRIGRHLRRGTPLVDVSDPGPLAGVTTATASATMPGPSLGWRLKHFF